MAKTSADTGVPRAIERVLGELVEAARHSLGDALRSVVLYGSAAEGRLRATSDVNLILVLRAFEREPIDSLREPLRVAQAAARVQAMLLLESEISAAASAFAAKFADIGRRRRVLYGSDPFAELSVPRPAAIAHLRQGLLNLTLRLRSAYVMRSLREEQLSLVLADAAGPLRAAAAELLELEGTPAGSPKQALERLAASVLPGAGEALARVSEARETRGLPPGAAGATLFELLGLAEAMRARAERLS